MRGVEQIPWIYDGVMSILELFGLRRWRLWLVGGARGRTLDIGCGTGRDLPLYRTGAEVVGVDPNLDALRRARRRGPRVPLVVARAEALPFRDGVFDTVVSALVFCSVEDPQRGLAEIRRVLRADGRLRMLEHVRATGRLAAWWQDLTQPAWTKISGGCHPNRDTETTVEGCGFLIEEAGRRAKGRMRRFSARPAADHHHDRRAARS